MQLPVKHAERTKRRSDSGTVSAAAGHIVKSGMTVIVRWGAIAVFGYTNIAVVSDYCFLV